MLVTPGLLCFLSLVECCCIFKTAVRWGEVFESRSSCSTTQTVLKEVQRDSLWWFCFLRQQPHWFLQTLGNFPGFLKSWFWQFLPESGKEISGIKWYKIISAFIIYLLWSTRDWIHGLLHAKPAHYYWNKSPAPNTCFYSIVKIWCPHFLVWCLTVIAFLNVCTYILKLLKTIHCYNYFPSLLSL